MRQPIWLMMLSPIRSLSLSRAYEREPQRWRAEIRKADGSTLKTLVEDSGHCMSITTSADTLTAETRNPLNNPSEPRHLRYGTGDDDPMPFILTLTPALR